MAEEGSISTSAVTDPKTIHLTEEQADKLARQVMGKQARLSLGIASIFLIALLGLPLFNWFLPKTAGMPIGQFTLTWLILGLLFYPVTWALSFFFVAQSDRIEKSCIALVPQDATANPAEVLNDAV